MRFWPPKHARPATESTHAASRPEQPLGPSCTSRSLDGRTLQHCSCDTSTDSPLAIWPVLGSKVHMTRVRRCGHTIAPAISRGDSPPRPSKMASHRQRVSEMASSRAHAFAFSMSTHTSPKRPERAPAISDVGPETATGSVDQPASDCGTTQRTLSSHSGPSRKIRRCRAVPAHRSVVTPKISLCVLRPPL